MLTSNGNSTNFHSSGLRQKIDQLMDILYAGGVNNPMDSIEQLSYLIFLRLLSEKDDVLAAMDKKYKRIFSGAWARYAWGNFVTLTGDELFDSARSAIEKLHELPGLSDTGQLLFSRATLKIYDRPTLRAVVQSIHEMDLEAHEGVDLKGDMYEYLLSKLSMSGTNGQFRTPRHIIGMMVALVDPQPGQRMADPACGTAGFLIAAFNYILEANTKSGPRHYRGDKLTPAQWKFLEAQAFTGFDNDANMVKIAILNLYLHGLEKANIQFFNPLTTAWRPELVEGHAQSAGYPGQQYQCILANPPFAGKIQKESILADINLDTRNTELLFVKWIIDHLAPGGRAGVIVPNGVLFGSTKAARTGDEVEASVEGFQIDLRRGAQLVEIQTRNFAALKRKLTRLVERYPVRLVHPIAHEKWVVRMEREGVTPVSRRKSPKRGQVDQLFIELVSFPELVAHPNLTLEVLMTREEEILRPAGRSNGRRASWRRKGWEICDRRLLGVVEQVVLVSPSDFHLFLPDTLPQPFTSHDLAAATGRPLYLAQKITYCLRKMGAIESTGKRGGALLYILPNSDR